MNLIKCEACGNDVSPHATSCPKCGHPVSKTLTSNSPPDKKTVSSGTVIVAILALAIGTSIYSNMLKSCNQNAALERVVEERNQKKLGFESNPGPILASIELKIKNMEFASARAEADTFLNVGAQHDRLTELRKVARVNELLASVKGSKDQRYLANTYKELMSHDPNNGEYKKKHETAQKKHDAELAAEAELIAKFGQQPNQNGPNGSYNAVDRYLELVAKDPESVTVRGCLSPKLNKNVGWLVFCDWSARNGFGGMNRDANWFVIRHDSVVAMKEAGTFR